jgi:hypothetical protein
MNESTNELDPNAEIEYNDDDKSPRTLSIDVEIRSLELGDVILIHGNRNTNIDQQTYYVYYIDELKLKLLNTSNHQLLRLNIDGYVADESITQIDLLSRSEVPGFTRQHKLQPPQWVDVHFNGDVPVIISGEITNLEEDMIELTTYPGMRVIYIDFAYQGIPESLPIDKIILREKPKAITTSLRAIMDGTSSMTREEIEQDATMELDEDDGQLVVNIPETSVSNPSPDEVIEEYLQSDIEIPLSDGEDEDGELEALDMLFEIRESDRRYREEIQVADLLGELVSKLPVEKRTTTAMKDIHKFVTRFKELRRVFSVFDENGDVVMPKVTSILHKPIIDHIINLDRDIKWIMPVTYEQNELMAHSTKKTQDSYDGATSHIETNMSDFIERLMNTQKEYMNTEHSDSNKYDDMMTSMDTIFAPFANRLEPEPEDIPIYLRGVETKISTEVLVSNDDKYQMDSSIMAEGAQHKTGKHAYTVRRYTVAYSRQVLDENTRKRVYNQTAIGDADRVNVRSIIMLPRAVLMQSQSVSPSTNVYARSKLSEIPIYKFRIFNKKTQIRTKVVEDLNKEIEYEDTNVSLNVDTDKDKDATNKDKDKEDQFLKVPINYVIGEKYGGASNYPENEETFRQFLNAIIPRTRTLIRWLRPSIKHLYSLADVVASLEPFLVESENITFKQYVEIRYYIKEKIRQYVASIASSRKTYNSFKNMKTLVPDSINRIHAILSEKKEFNDYLLTTYNMMEADDSDKKTSKHFTQTSSESLHKLLSIDGANAYAAILNLYLIDILTIPESVAGLLKFPDISSENVKMNAKSNACGSKFIAKKYRSITELRKDDNNTDVFYDKEYDDTPYQLLDKYKDEKKRFREDEQFREFFTETLIQKHDCPVHLSKRLADTILAKKKRVSNGEYAILETKPTIADKLREEASEEDKSEMDKESETRKRIEYYRRNNDKWELDKSVDEESFIDTNTLFCELSESCNKLSNVNQCVPSDMAALQMRLSKRARMIEEFESRVSKTFEEVSEELSSGIYQKRKQIRRKNALDNSKLYRQNAYSYNLGKYAKSTDLIVESPHIDLRERILGWSDFVTRQNMIYTFVKKYCRQPNYNMEEDAHWLYCVDTNTRLFPESLFLLASAFMYDEYSRTLDTILRDNGQLSDDGDAIVDKYTGYVLRKIDFSAEEGFDESGFRVTTNAVIEETDIGTMILDTLSKKNKVFENPTAQAAYNVFLVLSENMGILKDTVESSIEEFVLRVSMEMMNDPSIVMAAEPYNEQLALEASGQTKQKKPRMPYSVYYNQLLIIIVSCSTFAAMQTLIPSFNTKKTFPGCVKSFAGFPLDANSENISGLKYIACVLDKSKRASELPWSAIEPLSVDNLLKRMKTVMQNYMYVRPDVQKLYDIKRDYLVNYPDQVVPDDVAIRRWIHFMPPVVPFSTEPNSVKGISDEYEKELFQSILHGSSEQFKSIGIIKGKLLKHGYFTYEIIDNIVRKKQMLLSSGGGSAFLENACCNEDGSKTNPIAYFQQERPDLTQVLQKAKRMESVLNKVTELTKAKTLFDPKSSRIVGAAIPDTIISRTIYETYIHFCNFDNDAVIPSDLIPLAATKPEYNRFASLDEKIAFMKKHGKNYGIEDFYSIMRVINSRNMIYRMVDKDIAALSGLKDMLNYFDDKNSSLIEERLRELLRSTLSDYESNVAVHEERVNNRKLNRYLQRANAGMREAIISFLDTHANTSLSNLDKLSSFLENISEWKFGDTATTVKEIYNIIYNISKVYPNKALANKFQSNIPKHWSFSVVHRKYLEDSAESFYKEIAAMSGDNSNTTFNRYLNTVVANLTDLVLFVEQIPVFAPLVREGVKYWSLYSEETILLLCQYGVLSALHEYVVLANDKGFAHMRAEEIKTNKKRQTETGEEFSDFAFEDLDMNEDYGATNQIRQIHIVESDTTELKKMAAAWISAILTRERDTKLAFNRNYNEIINYTSSLKYKDKKHITDYLAKLTRDERRVEQALRKHKIGRWNVGMQKGLYQYEKSAYDKEIAQWHTDDVNVSDAIQSSLAVIGEDADNIGDGDEVEDLERMERIQQSEEYDQGDGWENLDENYMDGIYYEEDAEREDYDEY